MESPNRFRVYKAGTGVLGAEINGLVRAFMGLFACILWNSVAIGKSHGQFFSLSWSPFLSLNICSSHLLCLECCSFRFFTQLDYSQSSALNLNVTHPEGLSLSSLLCQSLLSLFLTPCHPPNYWKEQQQYSVLTWGGVAVISILRTSEPKLSLRPKVTQQERKLGLESRLDEATVLNLSHSRFLYML